MGQLQSHVKSPTFTLSKKGAMDRWRLVRVVRTLPREGDSGAGEPVKSPLPSFQRGELKTVSARTLEMLRNASFRITQALFTLHL